MKEIKGFKNNKQQVSVTFNYNLFIRETVVEMIVGMNWVQRPSLIDI